MAQPAPVVPAALAGRFIGAYSAPIRLACLIATAVATAPPLIGLAVVLVSITGKATVGCGPMWSYQASSITLAAIASADTGWAARSWYSAAIVAERGKGGLKD